MKGNRIHHRSVIPAFMLMISSASLAQGVLDEVRVSAPRLHHSLENNDLRVDSLPVRDMAINNLGEALQTESSVYIRSYGPGLAGTISRQGFSPSQSVVYWNGLPLNSPALGLADLGSLPVNGSIWIDDGAGASLFGSGYMGGGIHLLTSPESDSGFTAKVSGSYHSAGLFSHKEEVAYRSGAVSNTISFTALQGPLDFKYTDIYGQERKRLGADQQSHHLRYEGEWDNKRNTLRWGFWGSELDRGIPRSISELYEEGARQTDNVTRAYLSYARTATLWMLHLQTSHYRENQQYFSEVVSDTNIALAQYTNADLEYTPRDYLSVKLAIDHAYQSVSGTSKDTTGIHRIGGAVRMDYRPAANWRFTGGLRIENQRSWTPLLPGFGAQWNRNALSVQVSYRHHFRFPTLNDLFWSPGGNPDLEPELGKTLNLLTEKKWSGSYGLIRLHASAFVAKIDNYIQWVPAGAFFEPRNVKSVQSAGTTVGGGVSYPINGKWSVGMEGEYTYTRSRTTESDRLNDPSLGMQLIYTPEHKASISLSANRNGIRFWSRSTWTGEVHTTTDNQPLLAIPTFLLVDAGVQVPFELYGLETSFKLAVHNLLNVEYSYQRFYPMPGIQGSLTLLIQIQSHEN